VWCIIISIELEQPRHEELERRNLKGIRLKISALARHAWEFFQLPTPADSGQLYNPHPFFFSTKKKCHAGRFDDSYRRHSAFDSLSLSFFEINTRVRKCLDAFNHVGACQFLCWDISCSSSLVLLMMIASILGEHLYEFFH
jgi:hypothetical protein